jgi:signal transduction histidine kinase
MSGVPTRIAGIAIPDSALARDATEFARDAATQMLVDHSRRVFLSADAIEPEPLPDQIEARLAEFTELVATAVASSASQEQLAALADEQAALRRVATLVARQSPPVEIFAGGQERGPALVTEALEHAESAIAELRELAHGILPGALSRGGLRAGVEALASRMPVPIECDVSVDRLPPAIEATGYLVIAESLTNVAKHAGASGVAVAARVQDGTLTIRVQDDGVGGRSAPGTTEPACRSTSANCSSR